MPVSCNNLSQMMSLYISFRYSVDYDVTAFVNDVDPPFKIVLEDFQDVILRNFDVREEDMTVTRHSVQFSMDGVDFDLLVATNLAKSHSRGVPLYSHNL